jgi:hypothetical protein
MEPRPFLRGGGVSFIFRLFDRFACTETRQQTAEKSTTEYVFVNYQWFFLSLLKDRQTEQRKRETAT